ncbi:MAG: serine/threonine protein kinase [Planctomycetes bacterium]|nr:serine/threonine protein kinase [Planctomycetota bacterium]
MEHREDAILCQHLLRTGAVPVAHLVASAEAQRAARAAGQPVPRLEELLVARGAIDPQRLEAVRRAALGLVAPRRRRAGSSSGRRARVDEGGPDADGVAPGDRLGQYEVTDRVARGSMGAVFAARCLRTDQRVALKVLAGDRARSDVGARRFVQESQLACSLRHEGLVRGVAFGVDQGRRYFVMELVDGPSLRGRIKDAAALPEREVARVGAQVARALAYLHGEGIVHRDVKPANILLDPAGQAKLCDLGLAREVDLPSEATASGDTLGTPRYMAPEQARGAKEAGPSSDLYSLGVTLFHAATGRPPFTEDSGVVVLSRHLFDEVPDPRAVRATVSPGLAAVIFRLTRKEPARRYATAAEAARALEALLAPAPRLQAA